MIGEKRNIFRAFAQWRQFNREYVKPVIQVEAEAAFCYLFLQVSVRCSNHAHINFCNIPGANPFNIFFLQYP